MKSLRKSLNKDSARPQISTPLPPVSKPPSALLPPTKVIRALTSHRSEVAQELSFQKGDFFYVVREDNQNSRWYEAHNPVSGARGLVPREKFEELNKKAGVTSPVTSPKPAFATPAFAAPIVTPNITHKKRTNAYYAVVMHDFQAERTDELDAKRGDAITVVAQSNREWFVAKPIDRVGKPGLIPVTFVELRDPGTGTAITDVEGLMDRGELPKVEDWKRAISEYKQNSISLGVLDPARLNSLTTNGQGNYPPSLTSEISNHQTAGSGHASDYHNTQTIPEEPTAPPQPEPLPDGVLISADVVSFHHEMDDFWFRIDAMFQPYALPGERRLPNAKRLVLFRVYNDFYDFQMSLLEQFPREAGRDSPHPRILPFMPGPANSVDHELTETRREELNHYLHQLCALNSSGHKYILDDYVVRMFLAQRPGDVESETPPMEEELQNIIFQEDPARAAEEDGYLDPMADGGEYDNEVRDTLGKMPNGRESDGSEYEDEGYATSHPQRSTNRGSYDQYDRRPSNGDSLRQQALTHHHHRAGSTSSFNRSDSPYAPREDSPDRGQSPYSTTVRDDHSRMSEYQSGWSEGHNSNKAPTSSSNSSFHSSNPSISGRSRSHSTVNTPPISAVNAQTAFVKIKIFVSNDAVAIRVHPNVSHHELLDKVQSRLGGVLNLKYRDSLRNEMVPIYDDEDLRNWMDGTDKHVLYAD